MPVGISMKERKKEHIFVWVRKWDDLGGLAGRRYHI